MESAFLHIVFKTVFNFLGLSSQRKIRSQHNNMSRISGSKRKADDLEVPDRGTDTAERKRILNVLAQRRYRQRKREHLKKLEARVGEKHKDEAAAVSLDPIDHVVAVSGQPPLSEDIDLISFEETNVSATFNGMLPNCETLPLVTDESNASSWTTSLDESPSFDLWNDSISLPGLDGPLLTANEGLNTNNEVASSMRSPSIENSISPFQHMVRFSENNFVAPFDFPDEANLRVMELDLLRAAMAIAKRMQVDDIIYSITASSPFVDPSFGGLGFDHLPTNLRPTKIQLLIPHHPILDILPWPTVRNKMIVIFSQPPDSRPVQAASPTSLLEFVYDIEDGSEGVRIWGNDPYSDKNWEVGEKVFSNWWWAFDSQIIKHSNFLRRQRGAPTLGQGLILGEL